MNARPPVAAATLALLAACTSLDPGDDQRALQADLLARTAVALPANADTTTGASEDDVLALLREPLTAERAVQVALVHNHRVRALQQRLGIARAELVQAGLLRNPTADIDARFVEGGGTDLEFGLSQPVLELFFLPLRQNLAAHEYEAAKLRLTDELVHLVFTVRRAFVDAQAMEQLVAVHRDALAAAAAAHELAVELHAAGNLTDQALAGERVFESRMRLELAAAEQAAREAREPLQHLLGLWGAQTDWTLAAPLSPEPLAAIDLAHVESRAIAASLDLRAHRAGLNALAQEVGLDSWRGWFPDLSLGPNGIRIPGGTWGFGPRAQLELPLFDAGGTRTTRDRARLQAGLHEHVQLAVEVRAAARLLRERAGRLAERERFLREVHLPHRDTVVRTTLQTYNAMQIGVFDVLQQKQLQLADRRDHVTTLQKAHLAHLDLQQLLAGSQPGAVLERLVEGAGDTPTIRGADPGVVR